MNMKIKAVAPRTPPPTETISLNTLGTRVLNLRVALSAIENEATNFEKLMGEACSYLFGEKDASGEPGPQATKGRNPGVGVVSELHLNAEDAHARAVEVAQRLSALNDRLAHIFTRLGR